MDKNLSMKMTILKTLLSPDLLDVSLILVTTHFLKIQFIWMTLLALKVEFSLPIISDMKFSFKAHLLIYLTTKQVKKPFR